MVKRTRSKPRAQTKDILGSQPGKRTERVPAKWRTEYQRLVRLRGTLLRQRETLSYDARQEQPAFSTHMADAGTDQFDRDFALGIAASEQEALYEIEDAIDRIRNGTYGICELTGKKIPCARLEAIPWTRFTAEAERELEKEGVLKTARIGPRESVPRTEPTEPEDE